MAADPTARSRTRIHVGGLGQSVSNDDLRKIFSAFGSVEGVDIVRTKGRSFAYVDIISSSSNSINKLFSTYNGCSWKGGKLKLEKAKEHFLNRLKREWAEAQAEAEAKAEEGSRQHEPKPSSLHSFNSKNKVHDSQNNLLRIFFPRLSKVKLLPFSGTGKHKYSFQRVQVPSFPVNFCDCEEHSGNFNAVKPKEGQHHEEINGVMNEEELSIMSSVMNKLFQRENVSDTSRTAIGKERDDFVEPVEDSPSKEEEEEEEEDDDLIINVVSNANKQTAKSGIREQDKVSTEKTRLSENKVSKDGTIPSAGKLQKNNTLHPEKKRKSLPYKNDKQEFASVSSRVRRNSQFNESEVGFEENEINEDGLLINVTSTANKGMAWSGSTKRAKMFKSGETQTSEDGSTERKGEEENDLLLPKKKIKLARERDGNEVISTVPAEKGPLVAQTTGPDGSLSQSSGSLWSQKSSWKALVGDRGNSTFSLSNILQNVDTTEEKHHISDGPDVDNILDSKNEKLSTSKNMENMSTSKNMEDLSTSKNMEDMSTSKNMEDMPGKTEIANEVAEAQPDQPITSSNNSGRGSAWLHKSSWIQLLGNKNNSFSITEILPGTTLQEFANPIGEDAAQFPGENYSNIMERDMTEPRVYGSTASGVGKEGDSVESIPKSNHQTIEGDKGASFPAAENISNSEPEKGSGVDTSIGETCSFMRSSASLKDWAKTKAALKGSCKKKTKGDSI